MGNPKFSYGPSFAETVGKPGGLLTALPICRTTMADRRCQTSFEESRFLSEAAALIEAQKKSAEQTLTRKFGSSFDALMAEARHRR